MASVPVASMAGQHQGAASPSAVEELYSELLDDLLFDAVVQVHRRRGREVIAPPPDVTHPKAAHFPPAVTPGPFEAPGEYGGGSTVKTPPPLPRAPVSSDVTCENCGRRINASRFAPHLERCMGMSNARVIRAPPTYAPAPVAPRSTSAERRKKKKKRPKDKEAGPTSAPRSAPVPPPAAGLALPNSITLNNSFFLPHAPWP